VDTTVLPGLLLLALELLVLAAAGYTVARLALRQSDELLALAQGMLIGPALWGLIANFVLHLAPGRGGALLSWMALLALAIGLAWRSRRRLRPKVFNAIGLGTAAIFTLWAMLAARQLLHITDAEAHLGLASYIGAGGWPPVFSYNPGQPLLYHYGADLLIGLLAPPVGPDLPFTTELLGAYVWTGFALAVAMLLRRIGGWISLAVLLPLLFTPGAWTLVGFIIAPPDILQVPVPIGLPTAGLRASLADLYWPEVSLHWQTVYEASPPNIWKPPFVLAYGLAVVVLSCAASRRPWSWPSAVTLAALVGFTGLVSEEIALLTLALWGALEAGRVMRRPSHLTYWARELVVSVLPLAASRFRRSEASADGTTRPRALDGQGEPHVRSGRWKTHLQLFAGPALATLLLAVGGGPVTALLSGVSSGTSLGWIDDPGSRLPFGTLLTSLPGGVGLLGLGVVPVAATALLLARRQRIVLALVAGSAVFLVAAIALQHPTSQFDVTRMDGHARNFALLAVLLALSCRLSILRPRWRYAAGALIVILITMPTAAGPLRTFGLSVSHGINLANAEPSLRGRDPKFDSDRYFSGMGRHTTRHSVSEPVAHYIRGHTAVYARILSPHPHDLSATTGRPNASGFTGLNHYLPRTGPEFLDSIRYLEPAAIRRAGFDYVHAPDEWVDSLPDRALQWLEDPRFFEPLVRGDADTLYSIRATFLRLSPTPTPQSFESLRQAVPESAAVALAGLTGIDAARVASALEHTKLLGDANRPGLHLLERIPTEPLGARIPDVLILPEGSASFFRASLSDLPPAWRSPRAIWQSHGLSAYAASPTIAATVSLSPHPDEFAVRLSDVHSTDGAITFTATFADHASTQWTGQDWLVVALDDSVWHLPTTVETDRYTLQGSVQWYAGRITPGRGNTTHTFRFNPRSVSLEWGDSKGEFFEIESSGAPPGPGIWALALRLRHGYRQAATVPILRIVVAESGDVSYRLYDAELRTTVNPGLKKLQTTEGRQRPVLEN
jgi:hypothetical protein